MARAIRRRGNLPAETTSFIGRRRELAELRARLTEGRLVSVVGPGGVGKTRLAVRAATELGRGFAAGSWLVELADVREPQLVAHAVAAGLDLRDQAARDPLGLVLSYLKERELLLVVDNCEHLLEAVAHVLADVLGAAPAVRIIATSREPLSIAGEFLAPIAPLPFPEVRARSDAELRHNEAVQLFTERARAASGTFELNGENQAAVASICRRLDGMPLAIELAAVRTRALSVEQILKRLDDRFELLTRGTRTALPRHQTLRAAMDWSNDLLAANERILLRRLAVFVGRFTIEDVEAVVASADVPRAEVLDLISSLIDKSLVMKEELRGLPCHRLHETMREYAAVKMRDAGEEEVVHARCDQYYVSACRDSAPNARYRLPEWLRWLDLEIENVRAVIQRCLIRREFAAGVELVTSLGPYWITRGTSEGARWLDELLAEAPQAVDGYAHACFLRASLALLQADVPAARSTLDRTMVLNRASGNTSLLSQSLSMASVAANMAGDRESARELLQEALSLTAGLSDVSAQLGLLQARALDGLFNGDLDAVRSASAEGARRSREVGDLYSLGVLLTNRGIAALLSDQLDEAKQSFIEVLRVASELDDRVALHHSLGAISYHAARSGQPSLSAQLLGAADAIRAEADARELAPLVPLLAQARELTMAGLGKPRFEAEYGAGRQLSREAAIALALGETPHSRLPARKDPGLALLGNREADVARLVAEGMTNKQIGSRLFISERTVEGHVRSIMNKLGLNSRAQIAAWVSSFSQ